MTFGQPVYTPDQRRAVQQTYGDRNIRPARAIVDLAAAGELTADGHKVAPFTVTESSVRDIGRRYLRKRQKTAQRAIAAMSATDGLDEIRRRLAVVIDEQLSYVERLQARGRHKDVSGEQLRQIGRAARELAALPGPDGKPPAGRTPGAHDPQQQRTPDGITRGGLAGQILAASRPRPITPAPADDPEPNSTYIHPGDSATSVPDTAPPPNHNTSADSDDPGSFVSARIAGLRADSVVVAS